MSNKPGILWFTGLSGSGKSALAGSVQRYLQENCGARAYILDDDVLRTGLNSDLGFSDADRAENIRRAAEAARLLADAGLLVLVTFISPFRAGRQMAREKAVPFPFAEVHVACPLEVCEQRDPKGLYRRARAGEIPQFTGLTSPYEPPEAPELRINTAELTLEESTARVVSFLLAQGWLEMQ